MNNQSNHDCCTQHKQLNVDTKNWYKNIDRNIWQLNETEIKSLALNDIKGVNSSNSNNVSLENSRSPTFFDFEKNSKQRKSNIFYQRPSLHRTLMKIVRIIVQLLMAEYRNNEVHQSMPEKHENRQTLSASLIQTNEITVNNNNNDNDIKNVNYRINPSLPNLQDENKKNNLNNKFKKQFTRVKRRVNLDRWISQEYDGEEEIMKMHAFIVRDEVIPSCCTAAKSKSHNRYFMCSGAILTLTLAITTASCMHFADVYEKHINADLAVLVGGSTSTPYVIKINRYEMHPNYVYNIDNPDHAKHNLAILFLNCGFSFMMGTIVPSRLPTGLYDDIGHICCGQQCEVTTIVEKADNHHVARVIKAKHIPPPVHDLNYDNNKKKTDGRRRIKMRISHKVKRKVSSWNRHKRSSGKLAEAPSFLFRDSRDSSNTGIKNTTKPDSKRGNIKDIFDEIANAKKASIKGIHADDNNNNNKNKDNNTNNHHNITMSILTTDGRRELIQGIATNLSSIDEKLTSVDWVKIEQLMESKIPIDDKEKIEQFAKSVVDETIKRLGSVVDIDVDNTTKMTNIPTDTKDELSKKKENILMSLLGDKNQTMQDITQVFTNIVTSLLPPNNESRLSVSSDLMIEENDLQLPLPKYVYCPPLGTPVFKNDTLIAMIAYSCDDVESWVEWKYVSISRNLNWIRKRIAAEQKPPPTLCDSPFSGEDEISLDALMHPHSEGARSFGRRIPKFSLDNDEAIKFIKNKLKMARKINKPSRRYADTPSEDHYVQHSNRLKEIKNVNDLQDPRWRISKSNPGIVSVNSNTCVTKDGTTECQSPSEAKDQ